VDDGLGEIVIVPKYAQGHGAEQQATSFPRFQSDPTRGQNAKDFPVCNDERIVAACAHAADDTVRTRAHGIERLAARAAVTEKTPARALNLDIDSASPPCPDPLRIT